MSEQLPDPRSPQRPSERLVRGSQAARSLSDALWDELQEQPLEPARVAELSERLAQVASALGALAGPSAGGQQPPLADVPQRVRSQRPRETTPPQSLSPGQQAASTPRTTRVVQVASPRTTPGESDEPRERERGQSPSSAPSAQGASAPAATSSPGAANGSDSAGSARRDAASAPLSAVLVDELAADEPLSSPSTQPPVAGSPAPGADVEPAVTQSARFGGGPIEDAGIEIRDERREAPARVAFDSTHPRAPWMASIMRRLERYEHDRLPFAVLLVELAGIERLRHAELPGEVARLTGLVEAALAEGLRPADSLTRETPGRYWLLAPETDTLGAKALAARLAGRVRQASHRGAPLQLAVGIAACPDDGLQASALAAQADIALFAAQASGRAVGPPEEGV